MESGVVLMEPRKICIVTGTRAEYGLLKPVMDAITQNISLKLQIIVVGMHLSKSFGLTIDEIQKDGFYIDDKVDMLFDSDSNIAMAKGVGVGILGITQALDRLKPDIVVVLGDRSEALAATISASLSNIIVAHIHGGDRAKAGLDDYMRHAISKMSHIHFPATESSGDRIRKLGENPDNIFVAGAPGLDLIKQFTPLSKTALSSELGFDLSSEYILLVQHPVSTHSEQARSEIQETLSAVTDTQLPVVIIYPNSDPGGRAIIEEIKLAQLSCSRIKAFPSVSREKFLSLFANCKMLIGNSSAGIIESSLLKIPVINIGIRQEGREASTNVLNVNANKDEIAKAIEKVLYDKNFNLQVQSCSNPYGDGTTGYKIVAVLESITIDEKLRDKQITY